MTMIRPRKYFKSQKFKALSRWKVPVSKVAPVGKDEVVAESTSIDRGRGFTLVELLIGTAILLIVIIFLMSSLVWYLRFMESGVSGVIGNNLLQEGVEAVRSIRDRDFDELRALSTGQVHYLTWAGDRWLLEDSVAELIDDRFDRTITVEPVYRHFGSDDIVPAGEGYVDDGTLRFEVVVSWSAGWRTVDRKVVFYLTDLFK